MAYHRLSRFCGLLGLLAAFITPAFANYNTGVTNDIVKNHVYCTASVARNCWTNMPSFSATKLSASADGTVLAISSGGGIYKLPISTDGVTQQNWSLTSLPSSVVHQLAVGGASYIYALSTTYVSGNGGYTILKANSSLNGWTTLTGNLTQLAASQDGVIAGVNASGQAWYSPNDGADWYSLSGTWTKIVPVGPSTLFGLSGGSLYRIDIEGSPAITLFVSNASGTTVDFTASRFDLWLRDTSGNTYYCDLSNLTNGYLWTQMAGNYTALTGGGASTFALNAAQPYHFTAFVWRVFSTTTGQWSSTCSPYSNPPCSAVHSGTATTKFMAKGANGPNGYTDSDSGGPTYNFNLNAGEVGTGCDFVFGVALLGGDTSACQYQSSYTMNCSIMGLIYNTVAAISIIQEGPDLLPKGTYTKVVTTGVYKTDDKTFITCWVKANCSNAGTPICNPTNVVDRGPWWPKGYPTCAPGYDIFGLAEKWPPGSSTYKCIEIPDGSGGLMPLFTVFRTQSTLAKPCTVQ